MSEFSFEITARAASGRARAGRLQTPRGAVPTPAFMPVGTRASVKALAPDEVRAAGASILLANTYHLELRPGSERIERLGGLHAFMRWDGPILTDSGGFQVFSLSETRKVSEEGVEFRSPLDGSRCFLNPEKAMEIQRRFGSNIVMAFDECIEPDADATRAREALERTLRWLERCRRIALKPGQTLFPIVQGGMFAALRRESARRTLESGGWEGVAIGGLSVGEEKPLMFAMLETVTAELPEALPRYLMGVGTPRDFLEAVDRGVDMFDCVYPTRTARLGRLFTAEGHIHIKNARFREDPAPIQPGCDCAACAGGFSRAYLHHLYTSGEILYHRLATQHNLRFILRLMEEIRAAIAGGRWEAFRRERIETLDGESGGAAGADNDGADSESFKEREA